MLIPLDYLIKKYNLDISGISHFGAHVGQEVEIYKENNINNIYLFEPQKSIFEKLIKKVDTNEVFCFNFGLGPENFKTFINTGESNEGESASILRPKLHLDLYPEITFEKKEEIEIKVYDELNISDVNFICIDTQGYELEALKGCKNSLKKIDYIYTEVNRDYLYEENPLVGEIDLFLKDFGLIRVETKWAKDGLLPWGDAFYIKIKNLSKKDITRLRIKNLINTSMIYFFFLEFFTKFKLSIKKLIS